MTQESLITQKPEDSPQSFDESKNYYEELVGEGKKFKDNETLAKSKAQSDHYIKTLEMRLDEMRNMVLEEQNNKNSGAKIDELIELIKTQQTAVATPNANNSDNKPFDPKDLESLVSKKIQEDKVADLQRKNYEEVRKELKSRFGENYQSHVNQQMNLLGLSEDYVNDLARRSPEAFIRTMGLNQTQQETFQSPPTNRQTSFRPQGKQVRKLSYYNELKKGNPKLWLDPKIAVQMDKDLQELGEEFFDVPE